MLANIDREVIGAGDVQILECKTAGEFGLRLWKDGVPEYIQLQVQHQLAVTGKQAADVAVLLCGQQLQVHRLQRDEKLIARLMALQERFWQYVTSDTPPLVDGSDSAATALQCLYPCDTGKQLDFSQDSQMSALFTDLEDARCQADNQQALDAIARAGLANGAFEEDPDEAQDVIEEFYPDRPAKTIQSTDKASLNDKLGKMANTDAVSN